MIRRSGIDAGMMADGLRVESIDAERLLVDKDSGDMFVKPAGER